MYTVVSPDPNPRGGGQLLYPKRATLTSATRVETLTPNLNERNSSLMRATSGGAAPTYIYIYINYGMGSTSYLALMSGILR